MSIRDVLTGKKIPIPIIEDYEKWFEDKYGSKAWSPRDIGWFHPSQSYGCKVRRMLNFLGVQPDPMGMVDSRSQRIFMNGDSMHERIQKNFIKAGLLVSPKRGEGWEVPFEDPDILLRGTTDGLLNYPQFGRPVLELKSINANGFIGVQRDPRDDHLTQSHCYMHGLGEKYTFILYENKNNQAWAYHWREFEQARMDTILSDFSTILTCIKKRHLPEKASTRASSYPCRMGSKEGGYFYCPFVERCQKRECGVLTDDEWEKHVEELPDVTKDKLKDVTKKKTGVARKRVFRRKSKGTIRKRVVRKGSSSSAKA